MPLTVSFSGYADETASLCNWICPDHHYLESWNDFMPKAGHYTLAQPVISPLVRYAPMAGKPVALVAVPTAPTTASSESNWQRNMARMEVSRTVRGHVEQGRCMTVCYEPAGMSMPLPVSPSQVM